MIAIGSLINKLKNIFGRFMGNYFCKVYYEDTDAGGIVYYANYLKFLERARTEALHSIGYSNQKVKIDLSLIHISEPTRPY